MLKVTDIASQLDITIYQVHHYIQDKHLLACKKEGIYYISTKDYDDFLDNYYNVRHAKKGNKTIATKTEFELLSNFIDDAKDETIDYHTIKQKYQNIKTLIPPIETFIPYLRNDFIVEDAKTMKYTEVADKYNLSERSIKEIVKKSKERSN
jgi:hypothetical protein